MRQRSGRIDPKIAASYCLIRNYAKQAENPICFVHYTHEHPVSSKVTYDRSSDMCTIFIFLEGKFGFLVKDVLYNPNYGNVMIFRNYEEFTSVFYTNSHVDYYQIELPAAFFEAIELPKLFCSVTNDHILIPDRYSTDLLLDKLKQTEMLILSNHEQQDLLAYANVLQILGILASQSMQESPLAVKIPGKLKQAVAYIHSNYATLCGIEEVASFCNITNTYLSRMFQKTFQCTPNEYLNRLRISRAKYLLSTVCSLTDACYRSGFNNYTYFISKFKSITGITPAKFKENQ